MTTSGGDARRGPALRGAAFVLTALLCAAAPVSAGSYVQSDVALPDSGAGSLIVETAPAGLLILIDEVKAGRSPVGPLWLEPKTVHVRAIPPDSTRFDIGVDAATVEVRAGAQARVFLDLRPSVLLRTVPEPARVFLRTGAGDSLLGETPLRVRPATIEGAALRFAAGAHADSLVESRLLIAWADRPGMATIALRRIAPATSAVSGARRHSLLRRRWVQWSLLGAGAGLTAAAAVFKREGNRWYDRYQTSSDRDALETFFDRAERYDRLSLASLASGQILFTGSILLLANGSSR